MARFTVPPLTRRSTASSPRPAYAVAPGRRAVSVLTLRRVAAALLVLAAAVLAFRPSARGTPVLVAARPLPPGAALSASDVRVAFVPPELAPAAVLSDPAAVQSAVLVAAASPGEPITSTRLLGPEHVRLAAGPGHGAVPLRLADPGVARLLRPGTEVDVVAADPHEVLARSALVLAVHPETSSRDGPVVVLALPTDTATRVASITLDRPVGVTLR
ncbi:SAF domain-containing protein [Actinokineospora guangxiensis]|uniref:SAF domain-containing protein n=1 Tax=Actinokineospora guangxiensis TaxID=1490288 RepID=A0ABW0EK57_9PSEU